MYKYLYNTNSTTLIDEAWKNRITERLEKLHIAAGLESWENEESLAKLLEQISKTTTNTLVVIGNDQDFATLIGLVGLIDETIAIGYIPVDGGSISQKLQHKSWESAIEALAQRRIHETELFSLGKRYFLDSTTLQIEPTNNPKPIMVTADNRLTLRLPTCKLRLENLSDDQYLSKNPILFSAEVADAHPDSAKSDLLGGLRKKLKINTAAKKQHLANLHGKVFHIESAGEITDSLGRSYKSSLWIGKNSKPIRLITSRSARPN